ncbi:MAG: Na/Pi cotransporter family protein [Pseudomonadales bacterium]|nr:Na/Pi cotransporter family protein [Pseudomonadales bacterium]
MEHLQVLLAGLTAVILFIFGLENFSAEIQQISGERFRRFLARATSIPLLGLLIGALVTAVIQSSSATSVIAVSLVNAGVLSFKNSVGVIFGANVGTTVTAQLVAFKLTAFAPLLIVLGFILSLVRSRLSIFGKSIFYIGFVFFSLDLISTAMAPLRNDPGVVRYLTEPHNPFFALAVGCLFTAVVQSSSVTTGLAIIFTQQGLLSLENAVPIIMGANIGTTATVLVTIFKMDLAAKKTALSHLLFNVGGVILFMPVFLLYGDRLNDIDTAPAIALANIHLVFNLGTSLIFIVFLGPFTRLVDKLLGEGKMDFQRLEIPSIDTHSNFAELRQHLEKSLGELLLFLQENYNLVTLSIETNYRSVFEASARRIEYVDFLEQEFRGQFSRAVEHVTDELESRELLQLITRYDYLFQIHDSIDDLFQAKLTMNKQYIELKSDVLLMVRELSSYTLALFDELNKARAAGRPAQVTDRVRDLRNCLEQANRELLPLLVHPDRRDAGALSNFITYSRRLLDKLVNFSRLSAARQDEVALDQASPETGRNPGPD